MREPRQVGHCAGRKVLCVAPFVPPDQPVGAGQTHYRNVVVGLSRRFDVRMIVVTSDECPDAVLDGIPLTRIRPVGRALAWPIARVHGAIRRLLPNAPPLETAVALLGSRTARAELRRAQDVDLQWSEYAALAGLIRLLAPRARLVGTYSDVLTQLYARRALASRGVRACAWTLRFWAIKTMERITLHRLDEVIALTDKDAELLRRLGRDEVHVIEPSLAPVGTPIRRPNARRPVVVFVAHFGRPDNLAAAGWLVDKVWPAVFAVAPTARLLLVGTDPGNKLAELTATPGIEIAGFVADLGAVYSEAAVAVAPLQSGSGVKFKSIEAILARVPVVATPVGAEGIDRAAFAVVTDSPTSFSEAILDILGDPAAAEVRAGAAADRVATRYGRERFERSLEDVYGGGR